MPSAMSQAIYALRSPPRHRRSGLAPLPDGMLDVIKAAAGDETVIATASAASGLGVEEVREAARHYLLTLLLAPGSEGVRLLGLNPGATAAQFKDHKRWLLKWLHPDRNPSAWEQSLFLKVSAVTEAALQNPNPTPSNRKSRSGDQRRRWAPVERRVKVASTSSIVVRVFQPIFAGVLAAGVLVWVLWPGENRLESVVAYFKGGKSSEVAPSLPKQSAQQ